MSREKRQKPVKVPTLKEAKTPAKPASETEVLRERLDYATRLERQGSGVPTKRKFNGDEKAFKQEVERMSDAKKNRTAELLRQNGYADDAASVETRAAKKREKALYTKGVRRKELSRRRAEKQLEALQEEFDAGVASTWGDEEGEFNTLADREAHEKKVADFAKRSAAARKGAETKKANQAKRDAEYEAWYNETRSK